MGTYKIVEAQLPVVGGIGGHNLLVLEDSNGNVIGELDGLATGSNGQIKPIGYLPSDTLKVYSYTQATYYTSSEPQAVVSSGTQQQITAEWNAATACAAAINTESLSYPFLGIGPNSNSVASTLDACMGVYEPSIPGSALVTPGVGTLLLTPAKIQTIEQQNGVSGGPGTAGDNYVSSDIPSTSSNPSVTNTNGDGSTAITTFTTSSGSGVADLKDYNLGGTQKYEQINIDASNGQITSTISGSGDIVDLNAASISLAIGAQAAVDGANNAVNVAANVALTLGGAFNTVSVTGNNATLTDSASHDTITISATGDVCTLSNATITIANGASCTITGSNDTIIVGNSDTVTVGGSSNTLDINGNSSSVTDSGSGDSITEGGTGNGLTITGTNDGATVTGTGESVWLQSTGDGATVTGTNDGAYEQGTQENVWLQGTGDSAYAGTNDGVYEQGTQESTWLESTGSSAYVTGTSDGAYEQGTQENVWLQGTGESATTGNNDGVYEQGNQENVWLGGTGSSTYATGTLDTAYEQGAQETVYLQGGGNTASLTGVSDTANLYSTNELVNSSVSGETINLLGAANGTWETVNALDDTVNLGIQNLMKLNGNGNTINASYDLMDFSGLYNNLNANYSVIRDFNATGDYLTGWYDVYNGYSESGLYAGPDPLVLNLDGKSVQTVGITQSNTYFDVQHNGDRILTGWATAGEGLLVDDAANAKTVTSDVNLVSSFSQLSALDSNKDGVLNVKDSAWAQLKVWVDKTGEGNFSPDSLYSLDQLGITSINLNAKQVNQDSNGNTIVADSTFTWKDGTTGDIAGVGFEDAPNIGTSASPTQSPGQLTTSAFNQLVSAAAAFNPAAASGVTPPSVANDNANQGILLAASH